jgi:hypothetical protein
MKKRRTLPAVNCNGIGGAFQPVLVCSTKQISTSVPASVSPQPAKHLREVRKTLRGCKCRVKRTCLGNRDIGVFLCRQKMKHSRRSVREDARREGIP